MHTHHYENLKHLHVLLNSTSHSTKSFPIFLRSVQSIKIQYEIAHTCLAIFGFLPVLLKKHLQIDPNFFGESLVLEKALLLPMDPAEVWDFHSAISPQGQLLDNHAHQLQHNSMAMEEVTCPCRGIPQLQEFLWSTVSNPICSVNPEANNFHVKEKNYPT